MYDIIGDVHGHAAELELLLNAWGYRELDGVYRHDSRRAVFVGDLIDRGPQIARTIDIVRGMHDANQAIVVMGNHEFNALAFHEPDPERPDQFLRPRIEKNVRQFAATAEQLTPLQLEAALDWFRTLPMAIDLGGLRVVHACWNLRAIMAIDDVLEKTCGYTSEFFQAATREGSKLFDAIELILKGPEIWLPTGITHADAEGHHRKKARIRWQRKPKPLTWESALMVRVPELAGVPLPPDLLKGVTFYPPKEPPVFIGHYWLTDAEPFPMAPNVACLDYSVARGGALCGYRWDGEHEIEVAKLTRIPARK